jgi:protein-disulfide isomerase-like protein with CxxC motif
MATEISTTLYIDPACPWGYSASPALGVLRWRYGSQLDWRLVLIGLSESAERNIERGFTPLRIARLTAELFRPYGMPFAHEPKRRPSASARACRAVIAAGLAAPGADWMALRALQLGQFSTPLILEDDSHISAVVAAATDISASTIQGLLDSPEVGEAYARDRAEARTAAGTAAEKQGTTAVTDEGVVRYTAPSVIFEHEGRRLIAGGFQPVQTYDVLIANLAPEIERRAAARTPAEALAAFPEGLTTQEVAAIMASGTNLVDKRAAELALLDLVADGSIVRIALGDDAIWVDPAQAERMRSVIESARSAEPELQAVGF